jgi:hypothetical protein
MSRNLKTSAAAPIQKYCKVCHDAGKTETEYRSHFTRETRDPSSKVVCPTLLALECRYCFKKGHTVKYCLVLKNNSAAQKAPRVQAPKKADEQPKGKIINTNAFAALDSESEEEVEVVAAKVQEVKKEEFPALSSLSLKHTQPVLANYAAALAKPAPAPEPKIEVKAAPWASGPTNVVMKKKSWADWDSEDEEEYFNAITNNPNAPSICEAKAAPQKELFHWRRSPPAAGNWYDSADSEDDEEASVTRDILCDRYCRYVKQETEDWEDLDWEENQW